MSYLEVYIGNPDQTDEVYADTFKKPKKKGNVPKRISPFLYEGARAYQYLVDQIHNGVYEGKQIDGGAWAAKVNKEEIREFLAIIYNYLDNKRAQCWRRYAYRLDIFGKSLMPNKTYLLIAREVKKPNEE